MCDFKFVLGFSVNPEVVVEFDSRMGDEKLPLLSFRVDLSGSSADVAIALKNMGRKPLLLGLVSTNPSDEDILLTSVLRRNTIPFHGIRVLDRTSIAVLPVDRGGKSRVVGRRGAIDASLVHDADSTIRSYVGGPENFRIATGVRPSEVELTQALFDGAAEGYRVLNPNIALCEEKEPFLKLLRQTDVLIINEHEFDRIGISQPDQLHEFGPKTVIVTRATKGGIASHHGVFLQYQATVVSNKETYLPGAGDWFLGGFLSAFETSITEASVSVLADAMHFGAKVSGAKVTMQGAAHGPTLAQL